MWAQFKRVIKPRGAIVLTAAGRFTYQLAMSNFDDLKYEWVWIKNYHSNPFIANVQPLRKSEYALVFGESSPQYYPQYEVRPTKWMRQKASFTEHKSQTLGTARKSSNNSDNPKMSPSNILFFDQTNPFIRNNDGLQHPTQKPVALFQYLIRTYTQPGEIVLDPCVGSGTTAVAAKSTGRQFICGDTSVEYVQIARERISTEWKSIKDDTTNFEDLPLFR
jgi:site-specific DNA-methyltransferase (adenine-specific)